MGNSDIKQMNNLSVSKHGYKSCAGITANQIDYLRRPGYSKLP
jgi:hypothetical protein